MGEKNSKFNQNQEFTKKSEVKETEVKDSKEKADLRFNGPSIASNPISPIAEKKEMGETKSEVVKTENKTQSLKASGKVVSVSKLSYIVQTKDNKGVLVTGKHNKKIGDIV